MNPQLRVLMIDASSGFYKTIKFKVGDFFGPVDLGLHLSGKYNSINIGAGLLAGSIFPGSNRLIFNGFSDCWGGFYVSAMGGAALVFDNLGVNMVSFIGKAPTPSVVYLNRVHGEEIEVEIMPVKIHHLWKEGRGGLYALMDKTLELFGNRYETEPRVLATGPAAESTDFGAIASAPVKAGKNTYVDTWAGRGGFGSKLLQKHGIAAIIYGGTYIDEDFTDRNVANKWFEEKYTKKLAAKDIESTTKYRFDPNFNTGGTFGVNYASLAGRMVSFNYQSIYFEEAERIEIHKKFILEHYLKQFNEETIQQKQQFNCGEPCAAVCKKMNNQYKKDYEPYQTMGPLCGIFDQRAAEQVNHHADSYGFDAISVGGVLSWLMECADKEYLTVKELGIREKPVFQHKNFTIVQDSMHNAAIAVQLLDNIIKGKINLSEGARKLARQWSRQKGKKILDCFVYNAFARKGWMVPNQYWTPGALAPMAIMGKYYMYYGNEFVEPRELGRLNADRMKKELILDNMGFCRFHRGWAEDMLPDIIESLYGLKNQYLENINFTASRISSRNSSVFWESGRNIDIVHRFLLRKKEIDKNDGNTFLHWLNYFNKDKDSAALDFWFEMLKGCSEVLREF
ncbi:MAG TPA: aldehyde ferredoxin oxidoreductase N-terminal domain-containing protein [Bacteroidia bacterium]|nr:aldehyde ferredoxin oxidoreductase N-terminal domain-containing protein [Bacteroidia bacterium]HRS58172.1 aldehyde ferredoxin oxidoreductase N-terminal domain-containing protein [Bacteroidia bacterium]HRU67502.1 aldehyde ferredoxin oxidoreductase N-terminal domain-containing protein [Bacteroidia bacterium]